VDWIYLAQDKDRWRALMIMVMNMGNFVTSSVSVRFSRRTMLHGVSELGHMARDTDHWRAIVNTVSIKGGQRLDYLSGC